MKFENLIKDKLKGHEYKYTPDKWQNMEKLLNTNKPVSGFLSGLGTATKTIIISVSAASVIGIVSWLSFGNNNDNNRISVSNDHKIELQEDYKVVNNKNLQVNDVLSDCDDEFKAKVESESSEKLTEISLTNTDVQTSSTINTSKNTVNNNSKSLSRIHISENMIMLMEPIKQKLVDDEILPIIAVIPDDGSDYYFIPNPKHKIYDLPEPGKKLERINVEHKEAKEKKPINKPSKKVFSRKKGLLERLGFKR